MSLFGGGLEAGSGRQRRKAVTITLERQDGIYRPAIGRFPREQNKVVLQNVVRPVAEGLIVSGLAAAQIEGSAAFGLKSKRFDVGTLVRTIAKRLLFRPSAAAIEIGFAFFKLDLIGPRLCNDRLFCHGHLRSNDKSSHVYRTPLTAHLTQLPGNGTPNLAMKTNQFRSRCSSCYPMGEQARTRSAAVPLR